VEAAGKKEGLRARATPPPPPRVRPRREWVGEVGVGGAGRGGEMAFVMPFVQDDPHWAGGAGAIL